MAEVPEVEIAVRDLCAAVVGHTISGVEVLLPESGRFPAIPEFVSLLAGREVLDANRRAKYILLTLSGDLLLSIHFMLKGVLRLIPAEEPPADETLIVFHLDQEEDLRLLDILGYARAALAAPDVLKERLDLGSLGPEASLIDAVAVEQLDPDSGILPVGGSRMPGRGASARSRSRWTTVSGKKQSCAPRRSARSPGCSGTMRGRRLRAGTPSGCAPMTGLASCRLPSPPTRIPMARPESIRSGRRYNSEQMFDSCNLL